jgi:hypothetical protein
MGPRDLASLKLTQALVAGIHVTWSGEVTPVWCPVRCDCRASKTWRALRDLLKVLDPEGEEE